MAVDETPAQPICGAHPPYSDGHRWTCGKLPHRDDHEGDGMTWAQTRHEDEIRRRDLANAHRGEVVERSGVAIEPRDFRAQPDVAPAPDGNAGEAGDEVRLKVIRSRVAGWFTPSIATGDITMTASTRRIIGDDLRYLLAELDEARAEMATATSLLDMAEVEVDKIVAQRDEARATLAEANEALRVERERNTSAELTEAREYGTAMLNEREKALAGLAEVVRQRDELLASLVQLKPARDREDGDEAWAKTDGGEWQWGVRWADLDGQPIDWLQGITADGAREYAAESDYGAMVVRRWVGPVELVTADGSASDA